MCRDFVVEVCFIVWTESFPLQSEQLYILSELSFLKLLVQEVEHMQFLLHKAACTKKLPDTSLSREHWS